MTAKAERRDDESVSSGVLSSDRDRHLIKMLLREPLWSPTRTSVAWQALGLVFRISWMPMICISIMALLLSLTAGPGSLFRWAVGAGIAGFLSRRVGRRAWARGYRSGRLTFGLTHTRYWRSNLRWRWFASRGWLGVACGSAALGAFILSGPNPASPVAVNLGTTALASAAASAIGGLTAFRRQMRRLAAGPIQPLEDMFAGRPVTALEFSRSIDTVLRTIGYDTYRVGSELSLTGGWSRTEFAKHIYSVTGDTDLLKEFISTPVSMVSLPARSDRFAEALLRSALVFLRSRRATNVRILDPPVIPVPTITAFEGSCNAADLNVVLDAARWWAIEAIVPTALQDALGLAETALSGKMTPAEAADAIEALHAVAAARPSEPIYWATTLNFRSVSARRRWLRRSQRVIDRREGADSDVNVTATRIDLWTQLEVRLPSSDTATLRGANAWPPPQALTHRTE